MVEGFPDLPTTYFGKLTTYTFALISHIVDPLHKLGVSYTSIIYKETKVLYYFSSQAAPGVLEHYETATRDPAFFSLHKNLNKLFLKYKEHLTPYKREEVKTE